MHKSPFRPRTDYLYLSITQYKQLTLPVCCILRVAKYEELGFIIMRDVAVFCQGARSK